MMRLAMLNHPRLAQAFVDYMAVQGIRCELKKENEQELVIYVVDDAQFDQANQELDRFVREPTHPRYQDASWQRQDDSGAHFHYDCTSPPIWYVFWHHAGPLTLVILGACVLLYLLSLVGLKRELLDIFHFPIVELGQSYQLWRLFTPALLHATPTHLIFNLFWWWYLGGMIERGEKTATLLSISMAAALIGNLAQAWAVDPYFIGLSGVVYGLVAYCALRGKAVPSLRLPPAYVGIMVLWLFAGFAGWLGPNMANYAHLGGLLAGMAIGLFYQWRETTHK